jgi:hypothetical protein
MGAVQIIVADQKLVVVILDKFKFSTSADSLISVSI